VAIAAILGGLTLPSQIRRMPMKKKQLSRQNRDASIRQIGTGAACLKSFLFARYGR